MSWADLSGFKRDLLVATGIVSRDPDRQACGVVIIDEMRDRFDQHKSPEAYYMALAELRRQGLIEISSREGRRKIHQMTPAGVRLLNEHRSDVDDSVRLIA